MKLSAFGEKLSAGAGILSLMDDLGNALAEGGKIMMGGGNPGHIPEIQTAMAERLRTLTDDEHLLRRLIGTYDPPRGEGEFLQALASLLRREYGWDLTEENICLTNGSQGPFFSCSTSLLGQWPMAANAKYSCRWLPNTLVMLTSVWWTIFLCRYDRASK
jgi:valine--pyruvate aminotransferase